MSFFFGMVIGLAVGIGLIAALALAGSMRSKHRCDLAATVAAFARITLQDSKKLIPPEFYPSWVVVTKRQKLHWLNLQLDKIWPYIDVAASELIKTSLEPVLEQYRPAILSSLKFSKLTLGTIAPQFTGVSVVEDEAEAGGVTLELDLQWDGNPNIILDIKTKLGVGIPVQVKDVGFTGVFRLIFKPLANEFPCFGALAYSLREKKNLDFTLKVVGGDLSSIPGISDAIEETIRDAIEDSITWPVRKIVPILPGDYRNLELKPVGTLEVKLVQGKELTNKELIGKSDPYAEVFIRPLRDRMKTSKIINNDLNPIWNEQFEFTVEDPSTQYLTVRIFDNEGVQASEFLGCAHVALRELEPGEVKDVWLRLVKDLEVQRDNKYRGQVHIELLYCPYGTVSSLVNPYNPNYALTSIEKALRAPDGTKDSDVVKSVTPRKDLLVRGVLSVTVVSAEDLPIVDFMGKADPFVVLMMKKSEAKAKTRVVHDTLNPVWNQMFDFLVENALREVLIVELWDYDTLGKDKLGRVVLTLTRAIREGEFQDYFNVDGCKTGKIYLHLKWSQQPILRDS